jgi:Ala-tRNA(Pro) deacylase
MGLAASVKKYLKARNVLFTLKEHSYSEGSYNTARAARIDEQAFAKGVLLRDEDFGYRLCVLPSRNKILRHTLNQIFDRHLELVDEEELGEIFHDCAPGAIPALGQAYGVAVIWDESLLDNPEIFIEAGDHQNLICLQRDAFIQLMEGQMRDRFSAARRRYSFRKETPLRPQPHRDLELLEHSFHEA